MGSSRRTRATRARCGRPARPARRIRSPSSARATGCWPRTASAATAAGSTRKACCSRSRAPCSSPSCGLATLPRVKGAEIIDDLLARGLVQDHTDLDALRERLDLGPIVLYVGFDPTAESLHIGNLVPLLLLRRFQLAGHRPIALAGGATGMIGDPGGRTDERDLIDPAALDRHLSGISAQLRRLLDFSPGPAQAQLVDNREWTANVGVLDFLRDVGKHMTVNQMLAKESVRQRVESDKGISFTEFSYMLLQANDFWWLHRHL